MSNAQASGSRRKPSTGHVALVKGKRGASWYIRTRTGGSGGTQRQEKLGPAWTERGRPPHGWWTRRMAEVELRARLTDLDRGTSAMLDKPSAIITFADACAEFLRYVEKDRDREPSTLSDYRGVISRYLIPRWGERDVASITAKDVEQYRDELKTKTTLSARTVVRHLVVLNGIFKRAGRVWDLPVNPASAAKVDRPPVRYSGEFRTLQPDDVRLAAGRMEIPVEGALILTAAFSGLRLGELLALRWRDVDFSLARIQVRRSLSADGREKAPKSGRVRSAPLVDEVAAALDKLSRRAWFTESDDLVFCNEVGEHLSDGMLRRRWYETLAVAGLPRVRLHDLRHAFGSMAVQGFAISDVQAMLGHAHITTTMRYVHHRPGADDAARLQRLFDGERVSNDVSNSPNPSELTERQGQ